MKSIALTLAVLFGTLSFASAETTAPAEEVILEEVAAEGTEGAQDTGKDSEKN